MGENQLMKMKAIAGSAYTTDINRYINCDTQWDDGTIHPFTAMPTDPMKYGADLYHALREGKYGKVDVAPTPDDYRWEKGKWVSLAKHETMRARVAAQKKSILMQQAHDAIAPLGDAIDLDMATDAEKTGLLAWKKYRVLLSRVDITQAPDIEWPEPPDVEKAGD